MHCTAALEHCSPAVERSHTVALASTPIMAARSRGIGICQISALSDFRWPESCPKSRFSGQICTVKSTGAGQPLSCFGPYNIFASVHLKSLSGPLLDDTPNCRVHPEKWRSHTILWDRHFLGYKFRERLRHHWLCGLAENSQEQA